MKIIRYILLCVLPASLWLSNCKDKHNDPEPQPQGNYWSKMTCKVGGVTWKDCKNGPLGKASGVSAELHDKNVGEPLIINGASFCDSPASSITIRVFPFNGTGKYELSNESYGVYTLHDGLFVTNYKTNTERKGQIDITKFDSINALISGSFYFEAYNLDSNNIMNLSEGYFTDVRYYRP